MSELYACCVAAAPIYRRASRKSPLETQLIYGEIFKAEKVARGWAYGRAQSPISHSSYAGYKGCVPVKALRKTARPPNVIVTALSAPLFQAADIKSPVTGIWPMNARFHAQPRGEFYETESGFLHMRHVNLLDGPRDISDFVTIAERHLGRPYIWGGVISDGLDCSGLVQASLRAVGQDAPRDSGGQEKMGRLIPEGEPLRRGDLIFWKGHVGIMQDDTRLLHANAYHMKVESEPLETAIARIVITGGPVTSRRRLDP